MQKRGERLVRARGGGQLQGNGNFHTQKENIKIKVKEQLRKTFNVNFVLQMNTPASHT